MKKNPGRTRATLSDGSAYVGKTPYAQLVRLLTNILKAKPDTTDQALRAEGEAGGYNAGEIARAIKAARKKAKR